MEKIAILMATYNGALYIKAQLHSIFCQTYPHFHLYISDDCSSDQTLQEIEAFIKHYPDKITLLKSHNNVGVKDNFAKLMMLNLTENYFMFCDQDDVWLPNKIQLSLEHIKKIEQQKGIDHPSLCFTDLIIVDEELKWISPSLWEFTLLNINHTSLHHLLVENIIYGCAVIYNLALFKKVKILPTFASSHDAWVALVASAFGTIQAIKQPTLLYRRHSKTVTDSGQVTYLLVFKRILSRLIKGKKKSATIPAIRPCAHRQAQSFLETFFQELSSKQKQTLSIFYSMHSAKIFRKRRLMFKHGFWRGHFLKNIGLFWNGQFTI